MNNYEYTTEESALRLLGCIADFSDDIEELKNEVSTIKNAFEILRNSSGDLEILSFALDRMLMDNNFENGYNWITKQ